jgi:hypothetical protein
MHGAKPPLPHMPSCDGAKRRVYFTVRFRVEVLFVFTYFSSPPLSLSLLFKLCYMLRLRQSSFECIRTGTRLTAVTYRTVVADPESSTLLILSNKVRCKVWGSQGTIYSLGEGQ